MGKNPVVAIIAVIILIVAIVMIFKPSDTGVVGEAGDAFWYDTGSKELFGAKHDMPPIKAPSGSEGVSAYVFANGSCDNAADRFIVFLEKFPDKDAIMNATSMEERIPLIEARLVRRENDADWVAANSEEGMAIVAEEKAARDSGATPCVKYTK